MAVINPVPHHSGPDWSTQLGDCLYATSLMSDWRNADRSQDPHWLGYEAALNAYLASRDTDRLLADRYASLLDSRERFQQLIAEGDNHIATRLALIRIHADLGEREGAVSECRRLNEEMHWLQKNLAPGKQIEIDRPFLAPLSSYDSKQVVDGLVHWLQAALHKNLEQHGNSINENEPDAGSEQASLSYTERHSSYSSAHPCLEAIHLLDASSLESFQHISHDARSRRTISSVTQSSDIPILYMVHAALDYMQPPRYSKRQIFCGPNCVTKRDAQGCIQTLQTPLGSYSVPDLLEKLGRDQQPAILIAHVDATMRNLPMDLKDVTCQKIMLIGDTHHLERPLQNVGHYLRESSFDLYLADCKKHHLHFFYESQPEKQFFFFPGLRNRFEAKGFLNNKERVVSFVGQAGKFHPWRTKILNQIKKNGFPLLAQPAPQEQAASIYAKSLISLNISLNSELNMRFFEVLAVGGFLLTDRISPYTGYDLVFKENRDFVFFEDTEDLCEKIDYYLNNPEQALQIARNGYATYQRHWNIAARRKKFINLVMASRVDPILASFQDIRFPVGNITDRIFLEERIRHYELLQDLHRHGPLQVFLTSNVPSAHCLDLKDLTRLDVVQYEIGVSCEPQKKGIRVCMCSIDDLMHLSVPDWSKQNNFDYVLVTRDASQNSPLDLNVLAKLLAVMNLGLPVPDYPAAIKTHPKRLADNLQKMRKFSAARQEADVRQVSQSFSEIRVRDEQGSPKLVLQKIHIQNCKLVTNRHALLKRFKNNAVVAEIGVDEGIFSQQIWSITMPSKLHLIDIWGTDRFSDNKYENVSKSFAKQIAGGQVTISKKNSIDAAADFPDNYFDWIYIDTDHSYETTRNELRAYSKKIRNDGVIAGHDYQQGNWATGYRYGVIEAVHEFCVQEKWEILFLTSDPTESQSFAIRRIQDDTRKQRVESESPMLAKMKGMRFKPEHNFQAPILHVMMLDKFIPAFIDFVRMHFAINQHAFAIIGRAHPKNDFGLQQRHPVVWIDSESRIGELVRAMHNAKRIILHGLWSDQINRLLFSMPWLLKKCCWFIWGGDLYSYELAEKNAAWEKTEFFRRTIIENMGFIVSTVAGDCEKARRWYGAKGKYMRCFMYPAGIPPKITVNKRVSSKIRILVGNSATETNCHFSAFEVIFPFASENIEIYCPLSYGSESYAKLVTERGFALFGEKFHPMYDFMPLDKYNEFLCEIDIAVFFNNRQQALGNIITLLSMGKKVYMRNDTSSAQHFRELGVTIFDVNEFNLDAGEAQSQANNQRIMQDHYSEQCLKDDLSVIFQL